jgi:tRNA(Ile)-lysidine synthetase-like protein
MELKTSVERHIRRHELIDPGADVTCLVSGGADSTCLWHVLSELGYRVAALHVNHGLRDEESEVDARFCRDVLGAEVVDAPAAQTEAELRDIRYSYATDRLRATGHTASDNVETVLYRLVSSGRPGGVKPKREDGVVRPLLTVWREETTAYCEAVGLPYRTDATNGDTKRGLIRTELLPRTLERTLLELLSSTDGTKEADLGHGIHAVREYDRLTLERGPVSFGPWTIESDVPGLEVRTWQPGDRLAGRTRKVQDVFTDAKVPRRERKTWPLVVREDEVVAIPGIVENPDVHARRS